MLQSQTKKNRFYYEVHFSAPGLARVGWALDSGALDLGTDRFSWGFGGTAKKSNAKNFEDYGDKFGDKFDVIGCTLDLDEATISFAKNGTDLGVAFHLPRHLAEQNAFFPAVCIKNAGLRVKFTGDEASQTTAPAGAQWVGRLSADQFIVNSLSAGRNSQLQKESSRHLPKAVILEPSRELAEQTHNCIASFKKYLTGGAEPIRQCLAVGGSSVKEHISQLQAGVDIVTGTIGRVNELVNAGHLSLKACRFFVIDEVDAFLAQGSSQLLLGLHAKIPRMFADGRRLQMIVCSATLHNFEVKKFAERVMFFPTWVDLKGEDSVPETVHHVIVRVDPRKDTSWRSLKTSIPTDAVHEKDRWSLEAPNEEGLSEAVKLLKGRRSCSFHHSLMSFSPCDHRRIPGCSHRQALH